MLSTRYITIIACNPTNGSWWIVQVLSEGSEVSTHCRGWDYAKPRRGIICAKPGHGWNSLATTKDGQLTSTGNQRNEFIVDTSCGNTFVSVKKGTVELRAGSTVKQIAAGNQDTAGTARPGCTPAG